ncbi:MAG TPA: FtsX-like permease family protein, partial [Acidimicrobiales bacterium]|nr:FtsX-like permease family protein [Acidimicrobiales bacterium]
MRVVGTATFPAIGNAGSLHVSMGTGVMVPTGIEPPAMRQATTSPDPNQNGPELVAVRLRSGVSASAALASLHSIADTASQVVDQDPNSGGGTFVVLPVQQPAEIVNYKTMGATPAILASGLAVGAVAALGLTLVASVRRRRRDLALLKTLGFVQGQVASVVSWQASVAALVGIVVGVPLGIIFGRTLWSVFAHEIFAVPKPTIPALEIVLAAVGALVLANLVAFVPGRIAARTPTAALLRKE